MEKTTQLLLTMLLFTALAFSSCDRGEDYKRENENEAVAEADEN